MFKLAENNFMRPIITMCKKVYKNLLAMNDKNKMERSQQGKRNDRNIQIEILELNNIMAKNFLLHWMGLKAK